MVVEAQTAGKKSQAARTEMAPGWLYRTRTTSSLAKIHPGWWSANIWSVT